MSTKPALMERLYPCERDVIKKQLHQRKNDAPLVCVSGTHVQPDDQAHTSIVEPCSVEKDADFNGIDLTTVGGGCVRHYHQLLIDKRNKRVAPVYVIDVGKGKAKRRRLASEVALVVRYYDSVDEEDGSGGGGGGSTGVQCQPQHPISEEEPPRFSLLDLDDEEARQQEQTHRLVTQIATRLCDMCKEMQKPRASARLVRRLMTLRRLPLVKKQTDVLKRRGILLRALLDSDDFVPLYAPEGASERCAGAIFIRFSEHVSQDDVLATLGMLLELSNPKRDLGRLLDISGGVTHYNGTGATWYMTEKGKSIMRPEIGDWTEFAAATTATAVT